MKANALAPWAYKLLAVALLLYVLLHGLTLQTPMPPGQALNGQASRNLFYHVPMWFAVIAMMTLSVAQSLRYLRATAPDLRAAETSLFADARASQAAAVGLMFNVLGLLTGILWSRVTWNQTLPDTDFSAWWGWDPIQVCALISLLMYGAYFLLRASVPDPERRAKVAAAYNIFAFAALIPLYFIIPRMLPGLHPTAKDSDAGGGSFIFRSGGINNDFRAVLYPAFLAFILLGIWLYDLRSRMAIVALRTAALQDNR